MTFKTRSELCLLFITLLPGIVAVGVRPAFAEMSCGEVKVRAGDSCDFLNVVVDVAGCGENLVNQPTKVICRSDGTAEVTFESSKASYQALLKKSEAGWTVAEPLTQKRLAEPTIHKVAAEPTPVEKKKKRPSKSKMEVLAKPAPRIEPPLMPVFPVAAVPIAPSPVPSPSMAAPVTAAVAPVTSKGPVTLSGSVRFRGEAKDNLDFSSAASDSLRFGLMKFRLDLEFKPRSDMTIFIEPQASRVWGKNEVVLSGATGTTPSGTSIVTSGGTQDSRMDLHQGYVAYKLGENAEMKFGRQILAYGDELLIGASDWNNVGRAFDAVKSTFTFSPGKIDLFWSKINERNDTVAGPGDKDLYGMYSSWVIASWMKQADLYVLHSVDASTEPDQSTTAVGIRLKSSVGFFDYRTEFTYENFRGSAQNQIDFELGATLIRASKSRISAEYFRATDGFDQFYPTGHIWLGYADYFSRRNIEGVRAGISSDLFDGVSASADYHVFARTNVNASGYNFGGAAYGTTGNDRAMADELDVVIKSKLNELLTVSVGGAWVKPGAYMQANRGPDRGYFYYADLTTKF